MSLYAYFSEMREKLAELQQFKGLMTAQGDVLEDLVKQTLVRLGFSVVDDVSNRADVIVEYADKPCVVEVKGTVGSAAEKHAGQLEKWSSHYLEEYEVVPKALLVVNAFMDVPITERNLPVFPDQMLTYSTSREHCLMSGVQLLGVLVASKLNPAMREALAREILDTVGVFDRFSTWEDIQLFIEEHQDTQ